MGKKKAGTEWWPNSTEIPHIDMLYALDFEDDIRLALGWMLDRWSTLEMHLFKMLTILLDGNSEAAFGIQFSIGTLSGRLQVMRGLIKNVVPEGKEQDGLTHILDKIRELSITRNKYVHGIYHFDDKLHVSLPKGVNSADEQRVYPVSESDILNHCDALERATNRIIFACAKNPANIMKKISQALEH